MTLRSFAWAARMAATTFFELPEVEIASSTSAGWPSARTCFAKMSANESSLPIEVRVELSVVSASAGRPGRSSSKRFSSSLEKCCESAAEPPLPQERILPSSSRH